MKRDHEDMMRMEEFVTAAKAAASLGIHKIRLTGGEPLVKRGFVDLCRSLSSIDGIDELCITTNGTMLGEFAVPLYEAGVTRLNISLDTLDPDKFAAITRVGRLSDTLSGIKAAVDAGFTDIRINTVLMKGFNDNEIRDFVDLTSKHPIDVRFIELMPIGEGLDADDLQYVSSKIVLDKVPELVPVWGSDGAPAYDGVSKIYRLPGAEGRVGLISPMSCEFCDTCNKIRLTADGMLKPCLHLGIEIPVKGLDEDEMIRVMSETIMHKPKHRDIMNANHRSQAGRNMNRIGG